MPNFGWKIMLSDVDISPVEKKTVAGVLDSGWISMGPNTIKFENKFKRLHKVKYAFALCNGTAALHVANLALGIKKGDEVICPSLTFVATANAVLYTGAKPVFADITSSNNLNISPVDIERKISPKTKAIIVVHYGGYPCDMERIMKLAHRHGLLVIEDCAHAPLVKYKGRFLGTFGDVGCFSFFANKNMTTGEGGMLITNDGRVAEMAKRLRSHGMTSLTWDRRKGHFFGYDVVDLGFNYRIDEMRSALGLEQLKRLRALNDQRRSLVKYYFNRLKDIPKMELPFQNFPLRASSCHIFPILLEDRKSRDRLQLFLKKAGIQSSIHYPPIHKFTYYQSRFKGIRLPLTEDVSSRLLTLPLHNLLSIKDLNYIIEKIKYFLMEE